MKQQNFIYASSYIRILEAKMLTPADFDTLLRGDYAAAVAFLTGRRYGGGAGNMPQKELATVTEETLAACPGDTPKGLVLLENDFHNLKSILKASVSGTDYVPLMLEPCMYNPTGLFGAVAAKRFSALPTEFALCAEQAYDFFVAGQGQAGEMVLDHGYFAEMMRLVAATKSDFLAGWVRLKIDLTNIKTAIRAARRRVSAESIADAMIVGGRIDTLELAVAASGGVDKVFTYLTAVGHPEATQAATLGRLDNWCDTKILEYFGQVQFRAFGFEVILAFLVRKSIEVRNVSMILAGLRGGESAEEIRGRLIYA